jgi:large subunit ribosomal protein L10
MPGTKEIPQEKVDEVKDLQDKFARSTIAFGTQYAKLTVADMTKLRNELRSKGIEYRVVKNNLARKAAKDAGRPPVDALFNGPTGLVFGYGEVTEAAKTLSTYVKNAKSSLAINGAIMGDKVLKPAEIDVLAAMPPKTVLMAQMAGLIMAPVLAVARAFNSSSASVAYALQARVKQLGQQSSATPAAEAPVAPQTPA